MRERTAASASHHWLLGSVHGFLWLVVGAALFLPLSAFAQGPLDDEYESVEDLIKALKDEDSEVRLNAAVTLGKMGPKAKAAVPALIKAVEDEYMWRTAATALGNIGPQAKAAIPTLNRALEDKDLNVQRIAAAALRKIRASEP